MLRKSSKPGEATTMSSSPQQLEVSVADAVSLSGAAPEPLDFYAFRSSGWAEK
jgi:hypothetical protein